jgi:hypothetical protein
MWLAMSLDRDESGVRMGLDLGVMRSLLNSYYGSDAWSLVESPAGGALEVVVATSSESVDDDDRQRLRAVAASSSHLTVHDIDSGHWVHVERPEKLVELIAARLPAFEG